MKYLDISANLIGNDQFSKLFSAVSVSNISAFYCRKGRIGGYKIDHLLFCGSLKLEVLDLAHNNLSDSNGKNLLKYVRQNVTIEKLYLERNIHIRSEMVREIENECQMNIRIKKKILIDLPKKLDNSQKYNVTKLCLRD